MENRPLAGRGILITRPREQAATLSQRVRQAGGTVYLFPGIEIDPPAEPEAALRVLHRLSSFDLAIFISPTAVQKGLAALAAPWPAHVRTAAIGGGTRAELERHGIAGAIAPERPADSEALLALPALANVQGRRIVIFRGEGGRQLLAQTLAQRGAHVEHAVCYRRVAPRGDIAGIVAAWREGQLHAVTSSSSTGLGNLVRMLGAEDAARFRATPLFVSHARIAAEARRLGAREIVVAGPGDREMADALVAYFHPHDGKPTS